MDAQYYREYYSLEREGWWFTARLEILESIVRKFSDSDGRELNILNAGAATGATSEMLMKFGDVVSLEYDKTCCEILKEKTGIDAVNGSLTELPFEEDSFDVVCSFDVVEHIEDDALAISEIKRVLKPNGKFFFTVPAYQFLWSNHDEINHHYRRYTRTAFSQLILKQDLNIDFHSYFNFWLFPPIALTRFLLNLKAKSSKKTSSGSDNDLVKTGSLTNSILKMIFKSEKLFLSSEIALPYGVSFLAVGHK